MSDRSLREGRCPDETIRPPDDLRGATVGHCSTELTRAACASMARRGRFQRRCAQLHGRRCRGGAGRRFACSSGLLAAEGAAGVTFGAPVDPVQPEVTVVAPVRPPTPGPGLAATAEPPEVDPHTDRALDPHRPHTHRQLDHLGVLPPKPNVERPRLQGAICGDGRHGNGLEAEPPPGPHVHAPPSSSMPANLHRKFR